MKNPGSLYSDAAAREVGRKDLELAAPNLPLGSIRRGPKSLLDPSRKPSYVDPIPVGEAFARSNLTPSEWIRPFRRRGIL